MAVLACYLRDGEIVVVSKVILVPVMVLVLFE